jgi:hypothetical protein
LRYDIDIPGRRAKTLVLATTMLDAEAYPAAELAALYGHRWNIETDLRSIKCDLKMDVLRCKKPGMVEKEVWIHLLAYNLIHRTMARAADAAGRAPREVSFKGALQTRTAFQNALRWTERGGASAPLGGIAPCDRRASRRRPPRPHRAPRDQAPAQAPQDPVRPPG